MTVASHWSAPCRVQKTSQKAEGRGGEWEWGWRGKWVRTPSRGRHRRSQGWEGEEGLAASPGRATVELRVVRIPVLASADTAQQLGQAARRGLHTEGRQCLPRAAVCAGAIPGGIRGPRRRARRLGGAPAKMHGDWAWSKVQLGGRGQACVSPRSGPEAHREAPRARAPLSLRYTGTF